MGKPVFLALMLYLAAANGSPLSDEAHTKKGGKHSANYDHEAFLGKDLKKTFDELTPEESLRLLG